jgi:hypothetical protein
LDGNQEKKGRKLDFPQLVSKFHGFGGGQLFCMIAHLHLRPRHQHFNQMDPFDWSLDTEWKKETRKAAHFLQLI